MSHPTVVVGLDYGGTKIAAAVCDLSGTRLASTVVPSAAELGAQASFRRGIQAVRDLLEQAAPQATLAAVGVATFGIPADDRVELAPAIPGWEELALGRQLRAAFAGTQVRTATDAKAAAQAEAVWGSLAGYDPAVYLNLGTGLAAAIVVGGQVVNGRDGAAGEIGYNLRSVADIGLGLDQRIPLEEMVSGLALARRASDGPPDADDVMADGGQLAAADVFADGGQGGTHRELIAEFVDELAFHLVNLAICVNPARIAVGGGMVRSWPLIGPRLELALSSGVPFPPELVVARFTYDAALVGAIALALDAAGGQAPAAATAGPGAGAMDGVPLAATGTADGSRAPLSQDIRA